MLTALQRAKLLAAHADFVQTSRADIIDLVKLVEDTIPDTNALERKDWITHMDQLVDVWQRRTEGEMVSWPAVRGINFSYCIRILKFTRS